MSLTKTILKAYTKLRRKYKFTDEENTEFIAIIKQISNKEQFLQPDVIKRLFTKKWYKYIPFIMTFRHLYKGYLLLRLKTDTHTGFEYYWSKKRYDDFIP